MKKNNTDRLFKIFVYVALITLAISIIVPVLWVFMASIKENSEFYGANPWALPQGFCFENFKNAFETAKMGEYLVNSVVTTSVALVILLVVSLPASYVLARFDFFGKKVVNTLFMAGLFINVNYIVVPIFIMVNGWDISLANSFGADYVLLNNTFMLALIYAATALPFTIYLLSGFFRTLPNAYEEAAAIDGCGHFKTMTKVMIPMAKPSVITVILFNFLAFWNEYIIATTLMFEDYAKTLPVGLMNLKNAAKGKAEFGRLYAGLVIVMLPTLILYIMVQKKITQGMTLGGLKD